MKKSRLGGSHDGILRDHGREGITSLEPETDTFDFPDGFPGDWHKRKEVQRSE